VIVRAIHDRNTKEVRAMTNKLATRIEDDISKKRSLIETLSDRAADDGRDLSDEEFATVEATTNEIQGLKRQLDLLAQDIDIAESTQQRLRGLGSAIVPGDFHYRSAGQLLWDVLHQSEPEAKARYGRVMRRAAEHMGTLAANTTPVAGDMAGLVVRPVVGPVANPTPSGMQFASAIGLRDVPASDGFGFSRPYIDDPSFTTGAGKQALEKGELASKAFSVKVTQVPLDTYGGYLNASVQLLSFQPSALDILIDQLRRRLEYQIEAALVSEMQESTGAVTLADAAPAADVVQAIYDAAAAYFAITKQLPSWVAMGPLGWARLGGLTDLAGRPLFPTLGAANAVGTASAASFSMTVAGLQPVLTPAIDDNTYWVGGVDSIEGYLYRYPVLEAVEPSVLGRQVAVAASTAAYRPTPYANATIHVGP
jgi:HK97 family phage major capsid protein